MDWSAEGWQARSFKITQLIGVQRFASQSCMCVSAGAHEKDLYLCTQLEGKSMIIKPHVHLLYSIIREMPNLGALATSEAPITSTLPQREPHSQVLVAFDTFHSIALLLQLALSRQTFHAR